MSKITVAQVFQEFPVERVHILMENDLMFPAAPPFIGRSGFVMDDEGYLHLVDRGGEKPFVKINTVSGNYIRYGGWGNGPGEVRKDGFQVLSILNNSIYVYDSFGFTLQEFSLDGELLKYEVLNSISMPGFFKIVDENRAIFAPIASVGLSEYEYWFNIYKRSENSWKPDTSGFFKFLEHPDLLPIKINPAMGIGSIMKDDHTIYVASVYSSLLAGLDSNGTVLFKNYEPDFAKLPIAEIQQAGSRVNMDPVDPFFYYLDIALCSNHIYALYSGEQFLDSHLQSLFGGVGNMSIDDIRPGEGKTILVFNKYNGQLLGTMELDIFANAILATDTHIFLVSWDDPIGIHVLKNTSK